MSQSYPLYLSSPHLISTHLFLVTTTSITCIRNYLILASSLFRVFFFVLIWISWIFCYLFFFVAPTIGTAQFFHLCSLPLNLLLQYHNLSKLLIQFCIQCFFMTLDSGLLIQNDDGEWRSLYNCRQGQTCPKNCLAPGTSLELKLHFN